MCTIGNKVIWPTGGVICHILVTHPRLLSVLCVGVFPRMARPVYAVPVVPVPCQSCRAPLAPCLQKAVPMMFLWWKQKEQVTVLASSFFLLSLT